MKTGKLIKELRIKKGLTQEELANKTEVSTRTIQRIENGEVDPRSYTLQMIAKALEVDFSLFIEDSSEEDQKNEKKNHSNWLGLLHFSGLIPLIFPTILLWNSKKEEIENITEHYRAVIGFQLIICGIILGCLLVYWKVNHLMPLFGVLLANGLFSIVNTIKVISGDSYIKMPFINYEDKKLKTK